MTKCACGCGQDVNGVETMNPDNSIKCAYCKKPVEEDSLFTRLCKKCTGQKDLETRAIEKMITIIEKEWNAGNPLSPAELKKRFL